MLQSDIVNTPGYYYGIAYFVSAISILLTNKKRFGIGQEIIKDIVFFVILMLFMIFTDGLTSIFAVSMVIIILMLYIFLRISINVRKRTAAFYCAKSFLYGELMASFSWQLYYYCIQRYHLEEVLWFKILELFMCYAIFFTVQFLFERHLGKGVEELKIKKSNMIWALIIAYSVFMISNMSYYSVDGLFSGSSAMDLYIIRTLVDATGVVALSALHIMLHENQLTLEVYALKNINEMQYRNYQISQSSMDMVNRKYHDLKHQIALLKSQTNTETKLEYLSQMEKEISIYETRFQTGNDILDAILAAKATYCQKNNIEFKAIIEGGLVSFMEAMDISALFGNLLDNAIESAEKLEDVALRLINLQVTKERNFLCIRTENYCRDKVVFRNGVPVTSKGDIRYHGYGIKSIKSIVEKYNGSMLADVKDQWFVLNILVPLG